MFTDSSDCRIRQSTELMNYLAQTLEFQEITINEKNRFSLCGGEAPFADLCFSQLWAWLGYFHYRFKYLGDIIAVVGITDENDPGCIFIAKEYKADNIKLAVDYLSPAFERFGYPLEVHYIPDEILKHFQSLDEYDVSVSFDRSQSDYIYLTDEFLSLSGRENKGKRNELRVFRERNTGCTFKNYTDELYDDLLTVFDGWCETHSCDQCFYGCEKKAFERMMAVYDENFLCSLVYINDIPVSFGLAEKINKSFTVFHMQKNSVRLSGLTFYLHYMMAQYHKDTPYVNWGEDMGIQGIRENKLKYRPVEIKPKFSIILKRKGSLNVTD